MNTEAIIKRKSCRTFDKSYLAADVKEELQLFIQCNNRGINGEIIDIFILERGEREKQMKLIYGVIRGNKTYLMGFTEDSPESRLNYGYVMQKIVLKATQLGLGTCWVGYFDHNYFNDLNVADSKKIPGLVIIGHAAEKGSLPERIMRYAVGASNRLQWDKLFFDFNTGKALEIEESGEYKHSLEMLRLAPSSSNSQPWRVFLDKEKAEFHLYKKPKSVIYEKMGMHELDLGIAMCHFEIISRNNSLKGSWFKYDEQLIKSFEGLQYIYSWRCE